MKVIRPVSRACDAALPWAALKREARNLPLHSNAAILQRTAVGYGLSLSYTRKDVSVGQLLATGTPSFQDKPARALCERFGCYDNANHSVHLRNKGNEFTGTKDKGWTLTAPGLKRAADLIKELNSQ